MRARPVRPNIYLPVIRFGVADSDWFSVLLISCAGYLAPIPFGITILYVPLQMWTWLIATAGSIAFFNYIRIGKRPRWLAYKVKAIWQHDRQNRALPNGRRKFNRPWLTDGAEKARSTADSTDATRELSLIELNLLIHEGEEHLCNEVLVMTN
jgi:hypothetical protein